MTYVAASNSMIGVADVMSRLNLREGMRVADLGCGGHGLFTLHVAKLVGPRGLVYAVDILKSTLAELAKKARLDGASNVKPIWSNLEVAGATPIPNENVDAALVVNVLFQSTDRAALLREARRIMKPGARLALVDWQPGASPFGPPASARLTPKAAATHAQAAGFKLLEAFVAGKYHYGLILTR